MAATAVIIEQEFDNNLQFLNRAFSIVGQSVTNDAFYKYPRQLYRWFVRIFIISVFTCMYPYIKEHWGNLEMIAQCNVHMTIIGQCTVKLIAYTSSRPQLVDLLNKSKLFRADNIKTEAELQLAKEWTNRSKIVPRSIVICYLSTIVLAILMPFLYQAESLLPYAFQLPGIPHEVAPYFQINFVYQVFALFFAILTTCVIDSLFAFFLQEACLQFDVIREKLSFVGEDIDGSGVPDEKHTEILHDIHVMHLKANEFVYDINRAFATMLFVQFAESTYGVTFLLINVAESPEVDIGIYSLVIAFLLQIFIWSWFGEQTRSRMNDMVQAMYNNKWYNLTTSGRKSLFIMMSCNQNEYSLNAGGLIDLTLRTFVAIMRTAYSYYAVMKDSNSK